MASLSSSEEEEDEEAHDDAVNKNKKEGCDWANDFLPEIVEEISGHLLSIDVAEYIRFRAVCKPWRNLTAAIAELDSRFRPRNWAVMSITHPEPWPHRRLLNLATAASISVVLPALADNCHLFAADGLLLTQAHLPPQPSHQFPHPFPPNLPHPRRLRRRRRQVESGGGDNIDHVRIKKLQPQDDQWRRIRRLHNPTYPRPLPAWNRTDDHHWTLVTAGDASSYLPEYDAAGKILYHSMLPWRGRCYFASPEGSVYLLDLQPPRLVEIVSQRHLCKPGTHHLVNRVLSFLVAGDDGDGDGIPMMRSMTSKFSVYHVDDRRIEPPHQFGMDEYHRLVPGARPCNLDQYLVNYVDAAHGFSVN
uniref:F-box domain-containing protein n=1 Tax=Leersia perrieri TaxID=77586 RepID=A0A0D9X3G9_9ORYZ